MTSQAFTLFAQDGGDAAAAGVGIVMMLFYLVIIVAMIAGLWKIFEKAGKPGWAAIVPIYNVIVLLEIVGKPLWWIVLFFIPCVSIVVVILVYIELAKKFGQGAGYGIGMVLLPFVFFPLLGFGDAKYLGPNA